MKLNTRKLVVTGMLGAISIIMGSVPSLGFIPIPPFGATIMHIPTIIGAIMEGPLVGFFIGLIFGGFSMYQALVAPPSPVAVVFLDPLVAVLPRVLIGITSYYVFTAVKWMAKRWGRGEGLLWNTTSLCAAAAAGTLTNTVGVFSMIYFRYAAKYLELTGETVGTTVAAVGVIQGLTEMIVAIFIVTIVAGALMRLNKRSRNFKTNV
jgi:uncharacterized membrane protein